MVDRLEELIGPAGVILVNRIADPAARKRVLLGLDACNAGLVALDRLDLEQYEMADIGTPDLSVWEGAAPEVRTVLLAVHDSMEKLAEVYPTNNEEPDRMEIAFGEFDREAQLKPVRDNVTLEIDQIVERAVDARIGETVALLTNMLKQELRTFGQRLRSPQVVSDRWFLLGELQEFRNKCSKCLEAIATTILASFGATDLEDALPRYGTEARRAAELRADVVDLAYAIRYYRQLLEDGEMATAHRVRMAASDRLSQFAAAASYRNMRALDKREVILFRLRLAAWNPVECMPAELREWVEGFDKYLDLMRGINQREQLIVEDRRHLERAREALASGDLTVALGELELTYGRFGPLDDWLRQHRLERYPAPGSLLGLVDAALAALAVVG